MESPAKDLLPAGRLQFLDAVRGIASLSVAWFHLGWMTPLREPLVAAVPAALLAIVQYGHVGVAVFFALSGFVITRSLSRAEVNLAFFGRFALRRSIRLDPPYWAALALAVGLIVVGRAVPGAPPIPSAGTIAAHVAYLQNFFGMKNIVSQFWTLPYELQFYLVACGLIGLDQSLRRRFPGPRGAAVSAAISYLPFALGSLAMLALVIPGHGWFLELWYAFFLGALTCRTLEGRCPRWIWAVYLVAVVLASIHHDRAIGWGAATTCLVMYGTGLAGGLAHWGSWPWLQWLGRISYSLYLTHFIGTTACRLAARRFDPDGPGAILILLAGTVLTLAIAWAFYKAVEGPSLAIARSQEPVREIRGRLAAMRGRWRRREEG